MRKDESLDGVFAQQKELKLAEMSRKNAMNDAEKGKTREDNGKQAVLKNES